MTDTTHSSISDETEATAIAARFLPLYAALGEGGESIERKRPLLAHYTSVEVLEAIVKTSEVWLSNPLFMNDLEEMRFGMHMGQEVVLNSGKLDEIAKTTIRGNRIRDTFIDYYREFEESEALDTYVFCLSEHSAKETNGRLSMWRGYGGQGKGVAIIFDTAKLNLLDNSPLSITPVVYGSRDERRARFETLFSHWCQILKSENIADEFLYIPAYTIFTVLKLFALTSKHDGFKEEQEWRVLYSPAHDPQGLLKNNLDYAVGPRGVEPKLKFKLGHLPGVTSDDFALERLVHQIILGPHSSSLLAVKSVQRMLERTGHPDLKDRVLGSEIPLRP